MTRPYYSHNGITIYMGDCLEVMAGLPDASFDAVICDLPYGVTACAWDTVIPFVPMWEQLKRLVKPKGAIVLFGSQPFTSALVMSNLEMFKYALVWDKALGSGPLNAPFQPIKIHEDVCVFSFAASTYSVRGAMLYNPQKTPGEPYVKQQPKRLVKQIYRTSVQMYTKVNTTGDRYPTSILRVSGAARNKKHETGKPVALLEYLILTYTDPGATILDFTMGSGTTLRAAKNLGRNAVGIELEGRYCEVAVRRLEQEVMEFV